MSLIKLGESLDISEIQDTFACIPAVDSTILDNFRKTASMLNKIAPKAEDFLYFSAVIIHAAEASAINDDGSPKLTPSGDKVKVSWDTSGGTWRWKTNDSNIYPFKNSNGDIFPAEELIKAYKKWIGKPLCIDHKSASVDHTRGFIVDTYYDYTLKRVVALCALDKANYPDLARKVSSRMQTAVSMGTAVGKAICTDCARVAQTEKDFCDHMKKKSGYGEINIDLNPIELSIVVNGADPKAHIKHIIAAANTMNSYLENRSKELEKLADLQYNAHIQVSDPLGDEGGGSTSFDVESNDIEKFKSDIEEAVHKLREFKKANISEKDSNSTNDLASKQSSEALAADETQLPNIDFSLAPPVTRFAELEEVTEIISSIEEKLASMEKSLNKIASFQPKEDNHMSGSREISKKGYYQGTEEPTPGQAKYPKDPLNEQLRDNEDKQMVGQSPFPGVGPVDGLHPSPDSVEPSNELERKKMLARAESEERALKRQAIVQAAKQSLDKKSYWQGGGGVNEPTPGKPKYPVDKLEYELREKEDKQMVGQKPFPGVGAVDGLHPSPESAEISDELKRKQMMSRANKLNARFVKASRNDGSQDLAKSAWEVYMGDRLLLTASVDALSGGKADILYNNIATKEYGAKLIETVRNKGADVVRSSLVKSGQDASSVTPPAPMPLVDDKGKDKGKSGDPKETALDLSEKAKDITSDLNEAVKALTGEQSEMGDIGAPMSAAASETFSTSNLNMIRKELNADLIHAMKESIASLNTHIEELDEISSMYNKHNSLINEPMMSAVVEDSLHDSKSAIAHGFELMTAFVKYAQSTKTMLKNAEMEAQFAVLAEGDDMSKDSSSDESYADSSDSSDLMSLISETDSDLDDVKNMMGSDEDGSEGEEGSSSEDSTDGSEDGSGDDFAGLDLSNFTDDNNLMAKPDELKDLEVKPGTTVQVTASLNSREGRAVLRAKLAADALGKQDSGEIQDMSKAKFSPMLDEADRLADGETELDTKPTGNLGVVETLPEINKAMMDLAKAPPKVRKEAAVIQRLVSEGKLDPADLDSLIAEGLDKDAVSYWKKYYGQVDGGSEFASELIKEHAKAQMEKDLNTFKVKMARSYELTYEMKDRGLIADDRQTISSHVDELMGVNDAGFENLKKAVARTPIMKKAGVTVPRVGIIGSEEMYSSGSSDDWSELSAAFSQTSRRVF